MTEPHNTDALTGLQATLTKASNLLLAVAELFSSERDTFDGGNGFAAHALTAAHALLADGQQALAQVQQDVADKAQRELDLTARLAALESALSAPQREPSFLQDEALVPDATLAEDQAAAMPWPGSNTREEAVASSAVAQDNSGFAETYNELLQRLTAVEVFANAEDLQTVPGAREQLLPLVQSLREELQRFGRVA